MHYDSYLGFEKIILILLDDGFDANAKDSDNRKPLWRAVYSGQEAAVKLLLSRQDLELDSADQYYTALLLVATTRGDYRIAELLIAREGIGVD